jgi:GAF domain-containing protein
MTGGPHARAVSTGEVVVAEDLQSAMADVSNVPLGYERDPRPPRVSIAIPLAVLGNVIGGLEVQIIEHRDPWSLVPGLQLAANLAAVSVDNLRLLNAERLARGDAESTHARLTLLAEASAVLASSLDYEHTIASVVSLVVPRLADWCCADLLLDDGSLRPLAVQHVDPSETLAVLTLRHRLAAEWEADPGLVEVLRSGQISVVNQPDQCQSVMRVPLSSRSTVVGVITFVNATSERGYDSADVSLAEDLARRAAVAIDNSQLYQEISNGGCWIARRN